MKSLKSDPWTGPCFSQLLKIGLLYYLHALSIILYESKKRNAFFFYFFFKQMPTALWNQIKLQYKWLVWPSVIHSVCVCVWDSSGVTSPLRTKTTSPAGSLPQVLLEIKQEISALWNKHTQVSHIFWLPVCCQQLNPIATLLFCVFWLLFCTFSP